MMQSDMQPDLKHDVVAVVKLILGQWAFLYRYPAMSLRYPAMSFRKRTKNFFRDFCVGSDSVQESPIKSRKIQVWKGSFGEGQSE